MPVSAFVLPARSFCHCRRGEVPAAREETAGPLLCRRVASHVAISAVWLQLSHRRFGWSLPAVVQPLREPFEASLALQGGPLAPRPHPSLRHDCWEAPFHSWPAAALLCDRRPRTATHERGPRPAACCCRGGRPASGGQSGSAARVLPDVSPSSWGLPRRVPPSTPPGRGCACVRRVRAGRGRPTAEHPSPCPCGLISPPPPGVFFPRRATPRCPPPLPPRVAAATPSASFPPPPDPAARSRRLRRAANLARCQ